MEFETEWKINGLNQQYARCLDEGRYEEWPTFFVEDAMYAIHSRENADAGLEGYIMYCDGAPCFAIGFWRPKRSSFTIFALNAESSPTLS